MFSVNQMLFAPSTVMPYGLLLLAGVAHREPDLGGRIDRDEQRLTVTRG
jgi:hypothetical protein